MLCGKPNDTLMESMHDCKDMVETFACCMQSVVLQLRSK